MPKGCRETIGWWDLFLKLLVRESPQDFVDWLFPGARFVRWRDGQFQKRGRGRSKKALFAHEIRADSLMEVEYEGQHFLIHVEFQSTKDEEIGYRLLGYSHGAVGLHKLSVSSHVIYVVHVFEPPFSPYTKGVPVKGRRITFDYESIELAEMPVEELEQKHLVGLTPLLLLAKGGETRAVLERAIALLEQVPKPEALALLRLLALRAFQNDPEMVEWIQRRFVIMHDFLIENSIMYKELVKEGEVKGEVKGLEKGRAQGIAESIETAVKARFPGLLDLSRERVARIHDEQRLRDILFQMITLPTEGEAHRLLMTL